MKRILIYLLILIVGCSIEAKIKRTQSKTRAQTTASSVPVTVAPSIDVALVTELLSSYVENKVAKRDASRALERLNDFYKKQISASAKKEFRDVIYQALIKYQKDSKNLESLAVIDVYQSIANPEDSYLPVMYYIRGDIGAHVLNDTLLLKDCIAELSIVNKTSETNEYITKLRDYLQEIRDYIPVSKRVGLGTWVSVNVINSAHHGYPYFILKGNGDGQLALYYGDGALGENIWAQNQTELMNDCAYYVWSNESLNVPSDLSVTLRNSVASNIGNKAGNALSNVIGSSFLGNIGGDLVGSVLGSLFRSTPKKVINICEATFHMPNELEIEANFKVQQIVRTQDNEKKDEFTNKVLFVKIDREELDMLIETDYPNSLKGKFPKEDKDWVKDWKKRLSSKEAKKQWNTYRLVQLYNKNEQQIIEQRLPISKLYHKRDYNELGIKCQDMNEDPKLQKKFKNVNGVHVSGFSSVGTAAIYGVQKGDVVLSVDGFQTPTKQSLYDYIRSLERFSPVKLKVLRGKKEVEIDVEHISLVIEDAK